MIVEEVTGQRLDVFLTHRVFAPLGMHDTFYRPADSLRYRIAPTEVTPPRGYPLRGEVHDENAYALGGVAGHAGLFSTAADLSIFAQMMLNGGTYDGVQILSDSTVALFTRRTAGHRALGWDTADGDYGFFDVNPLPGISYYRIKNNDLDGKSAYSIVIRVNRNKSIQGLSLYPNPVLNRIVSLQGSDLGRGIYKISIFGANGQEIYKQQIKHNGGTISQTIELPSTISKGIYMLSVKDENGNIVFNEKLVNQ
jgi:hypothetical protein